MAKNLNNNFMKRIQPIHIMSDKTLKEITKIAKVGSVIQISPFLSIKIELENQSKPICHGCFCEMGDIFCKNIICTSDERFHGDYIILKEE